MRLLPAFAAYLRQHHFEAFIETQLQYSRKLEVPVMKLLDQMPAETLKEIVHVAAAEFLDMLAAGKAEELIKIGRERWLRNELPNLDQHFIASKDITLVGHVRKNALLSFAPEFYSDVRELLQLTQEIDFFIMKSEDLSFETYLDILRKKLEDQAYLTSRITNTSPGIIYLFSLRPYSILFANQTAEAFFGYSNQEFIGMGTDVFVKIIHPDDLPATFQFMRDIAQVKDTEVRTLEFRMRARSGQYVWMRNYFSVFRRDDEGIPTEIIGNILNIQAEKEATEKLRESEKRYRQAEARTHIGHYEWEVATGKVLWSEEMFRIYELDGSTAPEAAVILSLVHPDDLGQTRKVLDHALETLEPFAFYFRIKLQDGRIKILQTQGEVFAGPDGNATKVAGTVQDISEKQNLIEQLRHSEEMYKQAEKLAHLGNFRWQLQNNELIVSDEIYRIYGLEPGKDAFTYDRYIRFIHPDDREKALRLMQEVVELGETRENVHRIIRDDGTMRYIYSVGQMQYDNYGKPVAMVGSAQDVTERQLLIEQLQESQKLYQQAQAMAQLGNWSLDMRTKIAQWSEEMFQIYEMPQGKTIEFEAWHKLVHPDDYDGVIAHFENCLKNRLPYDKVHRIILPSGKIKTLHRKAEIIYNEAGEATRVLGTTQDVSEQTRVQQELRDNQLFLQKITDSTPSIIATYNVHNGNYLFVSKGLQTLLGYSPQQLLDGGNAFFKDIIHFEDKEPIIQLKQTALQGAFSGVDGRDTILEFTYRLRHADGQYRWFHTYATVFDRNAQGEIEHLLNISLDVTEQKEASRKIEEQEHFIQNIADASPTILYVYDVANANLAYVNREIYFVLGYTPEEVIALGDTVTEKLYHPEDMELLPERRIGGRRIQENDVMIQYECRLKNKSGEWQWFLVREVVFLTDEKERPSQIVGAALDISKRKDMEKALLQNSFLLQQSNASLEEFAYVASHDLKEPLRKISTFGDRLAATQTQSLSPEGKIYLSKIVDASQRMQTMISDLLSISMISGNKSYEPYSLQQVLEETLQTLEYKIEQKGAVIESDGLPVIEVVPSQLRQLFQNLIANSLKFVADGVKPKISITHTFLSPADVKNYALHAADRYLQIELTDNGIGFENEFAGRIFLIFQRLHGRSEYEGSGIGLAICKKIVEHHGGIIYATGYPDKGAKFTIILPAKNLPNEA